MGSDGDQVRGTIERDFSKYLDERAKERRKEGITAAALGLATAAIRPVAIRAGKRVAEQMMNPDAASFEEQLEKIRARKPGDRRRDREGPAGSRAGERRRDLTGRRPARLATGRVAEWQTRRP